MAEYITKSHTHSNIPFIDDRNVNPTPLEISTGLSCHLKSTSTDAFPGGGSYHPVLSLRSWNDYSGGPFMQLSVGSDGNFYFRVSSSGTAWNSWQRVWKSGDTITGAVWNDYAEYRQAESIEPGRVVIEHESGEMKLSTERLQPGAEIISDTFGFAIGETDTYKTPIAVAGRVLAYPNEDRYSYPLGCAVCSGPNGTVSQMTREEIKEYPERIIGTVSEIPEYEVWGTGNVKVDGRIWIRIK